MSYLTIDQAGKVEHTNVDTILALCSDKIQYTVKIPKELKQELFNQCKARKKNQLTYRIFAFGLYLLLKGRISQSSIIKIDDEYPGHGRDIKILLLNHLSIQSDQLGIENLGKKDPSHKIAYQTYCGKLKPNDIISEKQLNLPKIIPKKRIKEFLK